MPQIKKVTLQSGKVRYRAVVDMGHDAQGKRMQRTVTMDTATEVRDEIARIRNQRATGMFVMPSRITVSEWLDIWLAEKAQDLEESTVQGYRNALVHAHSYLGYMRLQELTEEHVESMVAWLLVGARRRGGQAGTGLRPSTAQGVLSRLKEALGRAVVRKLVHANVAVYVKIPRRARKEDKRTNKRPAPWNVVEVKDFLLGIKDERLFAPLILSLMGLRAAEVAGLRWEDIDFDAETLVIAHTRTMIGNARVLERDTRTEAGERTLPLPLPVRQALLAFQLTQEMEQMSMGALHQRSGHMFVDHLGRPLTTRHLREAAYSLQRKLELRKVRLYDARHSCLMFLAVNGVPDAVLAAWAGHADANSAQRGSVRPSPEDLVVASDHLTSLLGFSEGEAA
ncbi:MULTISPECIES: tyrosine-type recombinase/integrase [unclassified Streptomyces]|uniref:tyrosine-type recombinase/integrase n=1 Tax=unclassified Streptomyces TaxID=2593676 RepID=UPI0036E95D28